jgi:DNA-binding HxlR family transcriptional regulator
MNYRTYDANSCIMTKLVNLFSGKWKPIILYLIRAEANRFSSLQKNMPAISKKILAEQLRELEADELIARQVHGKKAPYVVTYTLTKKGVSLRALMDEMLDWGLNYLVDENDKKMMEEFLAKPAYH